MKFERMAREAMDVCLRVLTQVAQAHYESPEQYYPT